MTALILLSGLAFAQDDSQDDESLDGETLTQGVPALRLGPNAAPPPISVTAASGKWPSTVATGAKALDLEEDFVGGCYDAAQLLYKRDYSAALDQFGKVEKGFPNRGVGHVGLVMVLQANMMENSDFAGEAKYKKHSAAAIEELELELTKPGHQAWEHFLLGAMHGIAAIHVMRRGDYLPAINKGLTAIGHIDEVRELGPDFKDILLFDGLWDYWKSSISLSSKALPDEDNRERGIKLMKQAESEATFMGPGASLSLAYTYIEEKDFESALAETGRNNRAYPHNVINNMVHARNYLYLRRYDDTLRTLKQVVADDPDNERAHYYFATTYLRKGDLKTAETHIDTYLAFDGIDEYHQAQAQSRKADIAYKRKDYATAESWYKSAVKTDGYKPAKRRLDKLKQMKKDGKY
ncbi:MAG: thioredoxin-like negative regulator of GroEL [Cognaticolwellia sp.]|jgi:thioredoxin-like negative regulator of GroEL